MVEIKKMYGDEYPAAIMSREHGRMPLSRETRFHRFFKASDGKHTHGVSRFMDGSASITLTQLKRRWPLWTLKTRQDFCNACSWLREQQDFPDMLRFVMRGGNSSQQSAIALCVACHLPQADAFDLLLRAMQRMDVSSRANILQAMAKTKHPDAGAILKEDLRYVWSDETLWNDDKRMNLAAWNAVVSINHLIEYGVSPSDFEERVRELSQHPCTKNKQICRNFFAKHYEWLR